MVGVAKPPLDCVHELTRADLAKLPFMPRSMMRGAGIEPINAGRQSLRVAPKRAARDGKFFVEESGLTLTNVQVLEAVMLSAYAGYECRNGELELAFLPGDAMRAMGIVDGSRAWLLTRLKELNSGIGNQPASRSCEGGSFVVMRTMTTDAPSAKMVANAIVGVGQEGLMRDEIRAAVWSVRLSPGFRAWIASDASLRHDWLKELRALKCGAAEAVARYALTGQCNIPLSALLRELGVIEAEWDADPASANGAYQAARRAIKKIMTLAPQLAGMGVGLVKGQDSVVRVVAESKNPRMRFFAKAVAGAGANFDQAPSALDSMKAAVSGAAVANDGAGGSKFSGIAARLASNKISMSGSQQQ